MSKSKKYHLLVVDDTKQMLDLFVIYIERMGYTVDTAISGEIALQLLDEKEYDLILLDIMMPGIDGPELLKKIKGSEALAHIPVIMISAINNINVAIESIALGAEDLLSKPIHPILLQARIKALLERKTLYEQERQYRDQLKQEKMRADMLLKAVVPIGATLSDEQDYIQLLKRIVEEARELASATVGTLYWRNEKDELQFVLIHNVEEGRWLGEPEGEPIPFSPVPIYIEGEPNYQNIAAYATLIGESVNLFGIDSVFERNFKIPHSNNTPSNLSFLVVPLKNRKQEVLGVLQLLDAVDEENEIIPFSEYIQELIESFSMLAVIALESYLREQKLRQQVKRLKIQIDERDRKKEVATITEASEFQEIKEKAQLIRESRQQRNEI